MKKAPAFQWYPKDILASARVAQLTLEEEGAYRRALDFCWLAGNIPADPEKLARLIGKGCTAEIASTVQTMFIIDSKNTDCFVHERLEVERKKQKDFREKKSRAGTASALSRRRIKELSPQHLLNCVDDVLPTKAQHNSTLQSPISYLQSASPDTVPQFEGNGLNESIDRRQATRARADGPPAVAESSFSFLERLEYARSRPKITDHERFAGWLVNGEQDEEIREFLKPKPVKLNKYDQADLENSYRVKIAYLKSGNAGSDYDNAALLEDLQYHFTKLDKWDELLAHKILTPQGA